MPSYVVLGKYTEQGINNFQDLPSRLAAVKEQMQAVGGRMVAYYLTMGSYDFVSVAEFPDNETGARFAIAVNQQGNVRTETLLAFTEEEAGRIAASLT